MALKLTVAANIETHR